MMYLTKDFGDDSKLKVIDRVLHKKDKYVLQVKDNS